MAASGPVRLVDHQERGTSPAAVAAFVTITRISRAYQREQYGGRWIGSDFGPTDLARLAETLGARGWRVERWDELGPALDAALGCAEPSVVDVRIDPWELGATLHKAPSAS